MGDAIRKQKKDPSKFTIDINSDGTLTFHSDGWPDLKLHKKTVMVSALSGTYEGKVAGGLILDMTVKFNGDGTMDIDINSDGTLTFHSDGWPDLKLKKQAVMVSALS